MGGAAERITQQVEASYTFGLTLAGALRVAVQALAVDDSGAAQLQTEQLEVAVLDRTRLRARKFGRVSPARIADLLTSTAPPTNPAAADAVAPAASDEQGVDALAPLAPPPGTTHQSLDAEVTDEPDEQTPEQS
jgi:proteasome alpha subunit